MDKTKFRNFPNVSLFSDKVKDRKIIIWGACELGVTVRDYLEVNNLSVFAFIDSDNSKTNQYFNKTYVYPIDILKDNIENYYVIIPLSYHNGIALYLHSLNYQALNDYFYFYHPPIEIASCSNYRDIWGNEVIGDINKKCRIVFSGFNSKVIIGNNLTIDENFTLELGNNSNIKIGDNCTFLNNTYIRNIEGIIDIGNDCYFFDNCRIFSIRGRIRISDHFSSNFNFFCSSPDNTSIFIGKDCMFSNNVRLISDDAHTIIDLKEKKNFSIGANRCINIGDHVWVGMGAIVLYNTNIQSGSIVGAGSVVKDSFPNNCIIAGNPARIIKTDVVWEKERNLDYSNIENKYGDINNCKTRI